MATVTSHTVVNGYDVTEALQHLELELHKSVTSEIAEIKSDLSKFMQRFIPILKYHNQRKMTQGPFNEKALELLARIYNVVYIKNEEIEGAWYVYFGPNLDEELTAAKQRLESLEQLTKPARPLYFED
jgi:hypothetical protein